MQGRIMSGIINFNQGEQTFLLNVADEADGGYFGELQKFNTRLHHGGYLCIADLTGIPRLIIGCGIIAHVDIPRYWKNCQEKALRLAAHPEHISSFQSFDKDAGKFPGAIRTDKEIISFSGMEWPMDEAYVSSFSVMLGRMTMERARKIAELSKNNHFILVHDHLTNL